MRRKALLTWGLLLFFLFLFNLGVKMCSKLSYELPQSQGASLRSSLKASCKECLKTLQFNKFGSETRY